ncbi:hypothetical protein [Streptomyces lunalinharesii]|uniref:Uncharacterized protein n=1 Tax=Streptomyces lunalinharesii TaxID=333384 RepID=A0ABN3SZF6_9ACTN
MLRPRLEGIDGVLHELTTGPGVKEDVTVLIRAIDVDERADRA